jgi:hypothetical protein
MFRAEAAAVDGLADVGGETIGAVAQGAAGAQMLIKLAEDGAEPPLVGEHALGDSEGEFVRIETHNQDCSSSRRQNMRRRGGVRIAGGREEIAE